MDVVSSWKYRLSRNLDQILSMHVSKWGEHRSRGKWTQKSRKMLVSQTTGKIYVDPHFFRHPLETSYRSEQLVYSSGPCSVISRSQEVKDQTGSRVTHPKYQDGISAVTLAMESGLSVRFFPTACSSYNDRFHPEKLLSREPGFTNRVKTSVCNAMFLVPWKGKASVRRLSSVCFRQYYLAQNFMRLILFLC